MMGVSSVIEMSSVIGSGVSGMKRDSLTAFDTACGSFFLQAKHIEAEPNTRLSHEVHLLTDGAVSASVVCSAAGVAGTVGTEVVMQGVGTSTVAANFGILIIMSFSCDSGRRVELSRRMSLGSAPPVFSSALCKSRSMLLSSRGGVARPSEKADGRSHGDSWLLDGRG